MTKEETIKDGIDVSGIANQLECLTVQYNKVVEQNRQLQQELREKTAECGKLKIKLMQAAGWYKTSDGRYLNKM